VIGKNNSGKKHAFTTLGIRFDLLIALVQCSKKIRISAESVNIPLCRVIGADNNYPQWITVPTALRRSLLSRVANSIPRDEQSAIRTRLFPFTSLKMIKTLPTLRTTQGNKVMATDIILERALKKAAAALRGLGPTEKEGEDLAGLQQVHQRDHGGTPWLHSGQHRMREWPST
jgi:hypothetical protein